MTPLNPDDAAAFHDAKKDALALVAASIDCRSADMVTIIEPHLARPYWMFNALLELCNALLLKDDNPRRLFDQLHTELLNSEKEGNDQ